MPSITSVVTPARFAQGLTYADFVAQAAVNQDKFTANGTTVPLTAEDISFFRKAGRILVVRQKFLPWLKPGAAMFTASCPPLRALPRPREWSCASSCATRTSTSWKSS